MGMDIGQYRQAADAGAGRVVLGDGKLDARTGFSAFVDAGQRFFGKVFSSLKKNQIAQNQKTLKEFRSTLTRTYGEGIALEAFNQHIGAVHADKGKPLSSRAIERVLLTADQAATRDAAKAMYAPNVSGRSVVELLDELHDLPDDRVKDALHNAVSNLGFTLDLLSESPAGPEDVNDYLKVAQGQLAVLKDNLERLEGMKDVPESAEKALASTKKELKTQIDQLETKVNYVENFRGNDPLSEKAVKNFQKLWYDAAIAVVKDEAEFQGYRGRVDRANALDKFAAELEKARDGGPAPDAFKRVADPKAALKEFSKDLMEQVNDKFKELGADRSDLKHRLEKAHVDAINHNQRWDTVKKDVLFVKDGQQVKAESEIRPANALGNIFSEKYEPGEGVSSHTFDESQHTVNLAKSSLTLPGKGEVFKGFRHGVNSAFGIKDPEVRAEANRTRATEAVTAVLVSDKDLLARALKGEKVSVPMTSISLLTPDDVRGFINDVTGKMKHENERRQLLEQIEAWEALDGQEVTLQVLDEEGKMQNVTVKPDIIAFNFGVNAGAVDNSATDLIGGWAFSDTINKPNLERFLGSTKPGDPIGGRIGEFLKKSNDPEKNKIVKELAEQTRQIWQDKSYMKMGHDPYKMPARLAILAHLVQGNPLWNCKSGKDRTGELDDEIKFLVAQITLTGKVPKPDQELSLEDQRIFREFALNTGNHDFQGYNATIAGYKTEGVDAITERVGDAAGRERHRGGSPYVKG